MVLTSWMELSGVVDRVYEQVELTADEIFRARDGDREAQHRLVAAYQVRVFALCVALAGEDAEDIAQEALLHGLRRLRAFDPRGPATLATYLLRIARNLCIDRARSARLRLGGDADLDRVADGARIDDALATARGAERIRRAVLTLPEDQRSAIALRIWGELDYAEIAAIEGVPVGTIRSRLSRARDALRETLGSHLEELADAG
jgi:RNA polymerase sigma-70 factor (ECF subfamily)